MKTIPENYGKPYSETEVEFLKRYYHRKGSKWTAERLGRSVRGVQAAVTEKQIFPPHDRMPKQYVTVTDAALMANTSRESIHQAANAWGARTPLGYGSVIDRKWAEWYAKNVRIWRETERLGWYGRSDIKRLFDVSGNDAIPAWARGRGKWGFAFSERVRTRIGMPKARLEDGTLVHATYFNPWDVEELLKDVRAGVPIIADSQRVFLMMIALGYEEAYLRDAPARYVFDVDESVSVGPIPQAGVTYMREKGLFEKDPTRSRKTTVTPEGKSLADELLSSEARTLLPERVLDCLP
jgi:hypothetical protein